MSTVQTETTDWTWGPGGGNYRIRGTITRTDLDTAGNKSTVSNEAWVESKSPASFSIGSARRITFDGDEIVDDSKTWTLPPGGSVRVANFSRTVTHDSTGNRTVKLYIRFSNSVMGTQSLTVTLKLNRISQLPSAPSSAPSMSRSGSQLTITSAAASGNGDTITGYRILYRVKPAGEPSYGSWITRESKSIILSAGSGATYQAYSQAQTARGWGPASTTRTYAMPADISGVGSVDLALAPGQVIAEWTPPVNAAAVIRYEAQIHNGTSWGAWQDCGLALTTTFTGLPVGTYKVGVRAVYAASTSPAEESDPVYLGTVPATIGTITLTIDGDASWAVPADGGVPISGYQTQWWDGLAWGPLIDTSTPADGYEPVPMPGIGYRVRARAVNDVGPAAWQTSPYRCIAGCACTI